MMWTEEQDQLVLAQEMSDAAIAHKIGRTAHSVSKRRFDLRHRYPNRKYGSKPQRAWTDSEVELASDLSLSISDVAELTGRTLSAVKQKRKLLKKGPKSQNNPKKTGKWSHDECELIMNSNMSDGELARLLGRSASAIASKRYHLRHGNHGPLAT